MTKRKAKAKASWSLQPALHGEVSRLLEAEGLIFEFLNDDTAEEPIRRYTSTVMGRFVCSKESCRCTGWTSKIITIIIRMYPGQRYNAKVYHQRCKVCKSLSHPILDHSYGERVSYRLKKWSGVRMDAPPYSGNGTTRPHRSDLCEGCRAGHCLYLCKASRQH